MEYNNIYHSGVKGMKWGVRRYQNKDGSLTPAGKKRYNKDLSEDAKTVKELKKKKADQLSNAELRKVNERLQLEQNYGNLNKKKVGAGRKFVNEITREVGKEIAKEYVKKYAKKAVISAVRILL